MKKLRQSLTILLCLTGILSIAPSYAGQPGGPYIVWVDLDGEGSTFATTAIRDYLKTLPGSEFCGDTALGWVIFTHERPAKITNRLVRDALVNRSIASQKKLAAILRDYRSKEDEINEGLDGVIAFSSKGGGMMSIDAHAKLSKPNKIKNADDSKEVIDAFCSVKPRVYRD